MASVELMLCAGRDLEQIEAEILASAELNEETQAALWLYAWCRQERMLRSGMRWRRRELQATPSLARQSLRNLRNASGRARTNALSAAAGCGKPVEPMVSTSRSGSGW